MLSLGLLFSSSIAKADTTPTLFKSFSGNINFIGTQKTLRTQPDTGNSCAITNATTNATLSGLPAGATIQAAYLYWAGSGNTPDYDVTFEGSAVSAAVARRYTATFTVGGTNYNYFSGVVDVTATVAAKGNGTYSFSGLTVDNGNPWCGSSAVLGGWALLVVYSQAAEDFRVVNVYEGFQYFRGSAITLTPNNFRIPNSPINGKDAHLTWEGDPGNSAPLGGFSEQLTFNGNTLTDASNPPNNQFNSISTINGDTASYGVDFDVYDISSYLSAGQTSATTVYSSGGDLVLLSAQVISTTNVGVADLGISMTRSSNLVPGSNSSYTLNVVNNGPLSDPGPVQVVDTLPTGLSYVSASGSGWTCSAAGQTVTCNYASSLANGASAPALTLTVAVAAGASGAKTNTATVSGQAFDNISSNDTATDTYVIPLSPFAYYAMDEASWTGATNEVKDSSGNTRDADALGGITTLATPASGLKGDTCRGTDIPDNNAAGTIEAVDTKIDINSLGNAGTISFWYRGRLAWNPPGNSSNDDRTLLDATNTAGTGEFWLVLRRNGTLRFRLDNNGNNRQTVNTNNYNFAAGTWVHLAVTWSFTSGSMCVYVNGVADGGCTSGNSNITSTNNYDTLYVGDNRGGYTSSVNRGNSADGSIDEVRLYNIDMSAAQITADMNATHACVSVDHYELSLPASSITCLATPVTVTACADSSSPCTNPYAPASGTTATLATTAGALGLTTVTFNASGVASTTLSYPAAANGATATVTLSGEGLPAANARQCVQGASSTVADSCTTTFNTAGFIFSAAAGGAGATLPTQVAGVSSSTYYLRAVRTSTTTKACEAALTGANTVNFAYECNDPTACYGANLMSVDGGTATAIARNNNGSVSSYTSVNMTFDANGNAPFTFSYSDVGKVTLHASKAAGGTLLSALTGATNAFVVKPFGFVLSNIVRTSDSFANPGTATDETGPVFIAAGEPFSATVTAVIADGTTAAPNYGRESTPEGVLLTPTLVAPSGGNNPAVGNSTGFGSFTNGVATGTNFSWGDVGIIKLTPSVGDGSYLGAGDVTGTTSANVGRFTPFDFKVSYNTPTFSPSCGTFTYIGQPFSYATAPVMTVTARNKAGGTTTNYAGAWWKITNGTLSGRSYSAAIGTLDTGALPPTSTDPVVAATGNGVGTLTFSTGAPGIAFNRGAVVAPFDADISVSINVIDSDNIQFASNPARFGTASAGNGIAFTGTHKEMRFGRLALENAFGSELLPLSMPMVTQYYAGASTGFVANGSDGCTAIGPGLLTLSNDIAPPVAGTSPKPIGTGTTTATIANNPVVAGDAGLSFTAPGGGGDGYVDISVDLSATDWLRFDWDGDGNNDNDPSARGTFGVYQGSPNQIYLRERY